MAFETFVALVGLLAVVYACLVKFIQNKLIDRKEMEAIQAESKKLSDEFDKAKKANNKKKMDEIMEKQMEFLPRMNSMMFKQFKPMIFILAVFFAFSWVVSYLDPTVKDDVFLNLTSSGNGSFAGSYTFGQSDTNYGKWMITVRSMNGGSELGHNSTFILYGSNQSDNYAEGPKGEPVSITTDKMYYSPGDKITITASSPAPGTTMVAELDNGTAFHVDLPFTIPVINVQRIQQPYWWFIFVSLITNLAVSIALGQLDKAKKAKEAGSS